VKWGVVVFPGSNDDRDSLHALGDVLGYDARPLWHADSALGDCDAILLPGGFSYGDYLRCGALARFSPLMQRVIEFAKSGGPVLGICNGFQILCESGLLPGALVRNSDLRFMCRVVDVAVESTTTAFSCAIDPGAVLRIPIKNGEGCYSADTDTLDALRADDRVVFRYANGAPNGSQLDIAGITNEARNVVGLMPHPEHAVDATLGLSDGSAIFRSVERWRESAGAGARA